MSDTKPADQEAVGTGLFSRISDFVWTHGTFYRAHVTAFTIIPLISAGVFYACNGQYHVSFVDSLFVCYSAMTVTGLSTINLSTVTAWQQVILYLLMLMGDITMVSWIMVLVRKWYFQNVCAYIDYRSHHSLVKNPTLFLQSISSPINMFKQQEEIPTNEKSDAAPIPTFHVQPTPGATLNDLPATAEQPGSEGDEEHILSDARTFTSSPRAASILLSPARTHSPHAVTFGMTTSIEPFPRLQTIRDGVAFPRRTATVYSSNRKIHPAVKKFEGFGGFPGPLNLLKRLFKRGAPTTYRKLHRKMTLPYTETLGAKKTPWLSFDGLVVGRNSAFRTETLSDDQLEAIGGVEYRALRLLSYLIPLYFVGTQLLAFILFAPWLSVTKQYDGVFEAQPRLVSKPWYSMFIILGAYSGGGLSLVDLGMVPFQAAYLMIFALMFVILAGNHALSEAHHVRILDFSLWNDLWLTFRWLSYTLTNVGSEINATLSFLLQHPRRFPSHQTWFLVICLVTFSTIEWVAFEILDIGLPFFESLSRGPRVVDGLFQGLAARASGLAIVPVASASPALQFLYVVMMYIAVDSLAAQLKNILSYEAESLGVFEEPPASEDEEPTDLEHSRHGSLWHLERQLSIDIWWFVCGVFVVAIIERDNLLDEDKKWFDLFRVVFELVSAFGGIGLSLGIPTFAGAMRPLSKLVLSVRGRHRGLPVGVERAVTLPRELKTDRRGETKKTSVPANGATEA
ncbi:cation transport protein-domain-containing protein [Mycena sp. CBHHK59/15]|nr:cation transport protein-domain-containing protein [Mycena sp. CBHHK59/15]